MAIINAANNGNWSSTSTWPGGVFPTSADDVFANNRTVYIDTDINVLSLNTTAGAGGVAGGRFYANQGNITINSNIIQAGSTYCVTVTGTGTRTLSSQFIRASNTTNTTAAVLIQGTATALSNVVTYGNAIGGLAAGGSATTHPAAITVEGGTLTHYGFVSGGQVASRSSGIKIYQGGGSTVPVSAIVYGNIKGGTQSTCPGVICEFSPAATTLSSCLISIYGNLSGGDSLLTNTANNAGLYTTSTIHTEISGNIHAGSGYRVDASAGVHGAGTTILDVNIVGNIYNHPSFGVSPGIFYTSTAGNINITGGVVSQDSIGASPASNSLNSFALYQNGGTTLNIYGNVYACRGSRGFGNGGIYLDALNTTNIFGDVYGGNTGNAYGIYIPDTLCIVNVVGNVYGNTVGRSVGGHGIFNNTTARINISGSAVGSEFDNASYGVFNNSTGVVYAKRAVANSFGYGSLGTVDFPNYGVVSVNISGINLVEELVFGSRGQIPVFGPTYIVKTTTNTVSTQKYNTDISGVSLGTKALVDSTITDTFLPAPSNVRLGVTYNNNLTGTMFVPSASSTSFGTSVDNNQGTAYLTPVNVWNTQTTELTSLSTAIGYRLNNIATVESVGNILASYNI
jgi:hypothetical protein